MDIDHHILSRYFLGECSEREKEAIRHWLENDEAHRKQFVRERIRFDASVIADESRIRTVGVNNNRRYLWTYMKVACAIMILVGSSYLFSLYQLSGMENNLQSVYVPAGSRTSLTLPDGTLVWLNSNTTLTYPNTFSGKKRTVRLDGEAYFEVIKNAEKAFTVETDKYNVEVLGTTFDVEAYAKEPTFKTSLFSGKVKLYKEEEPGEELYLKPGQAAELIDNTLHITTAETNNYRWKDGLIILENKSFDEIMHLFEKYYDLQIIIENQQVRNLGYNGKLRIADGIDHALRVLQNDFRFTYKRDTDTDILYIY